jgi:hypothetical protein
MNITDTTPTENNLSGLDRKDFQKNINSRKTDLYILKNAQGLNSLTIEKYQFMKWYYRPNVYMHKKGMMEIEDLYQTFRRILINGF